MTKITIYSTPTCPYCLRAKKYLEKKEIEYTEKNVALDREGLKELKEKSGQIGVPVMDIGGTIIIGFNKEKINQALSSFSE